MSGFIQSTLTNGEIVIVQGRVSPWARVPGIVAWLPLPWFLAANGVVVPALVILSLLIGRAVIISVCTELAVTNKRVIAKRGFINRDTIEIGLQKVESIQVRQSVPGRLLNYGSLVISGSGLPAAPIPGIANPMEFRRLAMSAIEDRNQANGPRDANGILRTAV